MSKPFNKKTWLLSASRRMTFKYPPAIAASKRDKEIYYILSKKGKPMKRVKFTCAHCKTPNLKRKEVEQDHIIPLVSSEGFIDWNTYFDRYLCEESNFQYLCIPCHDIKSLSEGQERTKRRNKNPKKKIAKSMKKS